MKERMKEKKKYSSKKLFGCMFLGALLGFLSSWVINSGLFEIQEGARTALSLLQTLALPLLLGVAACMAVVSETGLAAMKKIGEKLQEADEEECDELEYGLEKKGAFLINFCTVSQALCFILLSAGYSMEYIRSSGQARKALLGACIIFIVSFIYNAFVQARYVRLVQNLYPEKKGDVYSRKFQKEWLESCDEAERESIYRSSYQAYITLNRWIPILLAVSMVFHLYLNTGIMAVIMISLIWLLTTFSYTRSCVRLAGKKKGRAV